MGGPDMPLHEQTSHVRSPRIPRPPQHLLQEPPVGFHGTKQLGLRATLHIRVPSVTDHPPRQELVVSRVELVLAQPVVMCEAVQEFGILENDGAVGGGTT